MKNPAFAFYSSDFMVNVSGLTMEERGIYITMLCLQHQKGAISGKLFGLSLGFPIDELSQDVAALFVKDENGNYYNEELREVMDKQAQRSEKQRDNGIKGGRPKTQSETQTKPKQNPNEKPIYDNENEKDNENNNENTERGLPRGEGKKQRKPDESTPLVVDLQACTVSGSEWRTSFEAYRSALRECYNALRRDSAWLAERKRLNPRVDVLLTLEKTCVEYWATPEGWERKKSAKGSINWKSTLSKSISQKFNQVYENDKRISNNQRGNALDSDYLEDLARRAGISNTLQDVDASD